MSDTPETDKQWADWLNKLRMPIESFVDVARKLERERDMAREKLSHAQALLAEMQDALKLAVKQLLKP